MGRRKIVSFSPNSMVLVLIVVVVFSLFCMQAKATTAFALTVGPDYMRVIQPSVSATYVSDQVVRLSLSTEGIIPQKPDNFISSNILIGFSWADLVSGKVFAVVAATSDQTTSTTISPAISNGPYQSPIIWHAHRMILTGGQTYPHDYCVDLIDQTSLPNVQISTIENIMNVQVFRDQIPFAPESFNAAVGFTLQHDLGCHSGLAMQISS
jgi:hypothetical protein